MTLNAIGLDADKARCLAEGLNDLLSNYQIFYMNVRGFHWNIKGRKFFELHLKFEELYNDLLVKVDEIAERILTLGERPVHSFSAYLERSEIKEVRDVSEGVEAVRHIVDSFGLLLKKQRALLAQAGDAEDEGSSSLMSDYISAQEKLVWMFRSFLSD